MRSILLVEDDLEFGEKCVEKLLNNNFNVSFSENAEKAKLELLKNNFDLIIIDLMLPPTYRIEGLELLKFIKSKMIDINVLLITTKEFKTTEIVAEAMKLGALDFFDKNTEIFFDKLIFKINEILNFKVKSKAVDEKTSPLKVILTYSFLFIIVIVVLTIISYTITIIGLPFLRTFFVLTTTAIGFIVLIIASQLLYDDRIKEKTWIAVLRMRIVDFPDRLLKFLKINGKGRNSYNKSS